jgi:eukaryotic-like serine/threonine-protein kinase
MTLSAGVRLGPYEILAPLGAGGMGEVYKAIDTRLGRSVAVKVLPAELSEDRERLARFESEARAASALNHPNIVTIFDVGHGEAAEAFLAMELVDGETLRERLVAGPLPMASLLAIASQTADGLAAAHESGIVHRDLKPENLMIRKDGLVKILDFGLAKAVPAAAPAFGATHAPTQTSLTEPGVVLGTVGYMSPEQAMGRPTDLHSDQFSLGAILYEMATGRRAFQRSTAVETLSAILRDEPAPIAASRPEAPEPLRWIVERCLAKEPAQRYASTRDLARDLARLRERPAEMTAPAAAPKRKPARRLAAGALVLAVVVAAVFLLSRARTRPAATAGSSIAILPFQNVGGEKDDEYFSDGMTDSLITGLARVPGLLVIARHSAFQYKNRTADVRDVGKTLGVRYVLEGSVQRAGDSVRVNAQLVDSGTGYHLWADKYDRPMKDIFAVQDDISRHIIGSLKLALSPKLAGTPAPPTKDLEAYDLYLRGEHRLRQMDQKDHADAIPLFEQAVALDPNFAVAHAALARAYISKFFNLDPDPMWKEKAEAEIARALALDPNLADAYVARGDLAWTLANGFPHEEAVRDFRKALEINPNLAEARRALGRVYMHVGLFAKAHEEWEAALRTDPRDMWVLYRKAGLYLFDGQPERALKELRKYPELENTQDVVLALLWLGRDAEAAQVMEKLLRDPPETEVHATRAVLLAREGDARGAEEAIDSSIRQGKGLGHFHHAEYDIACAYAVMGKKNESLAWLRRTAADGFPCYPLFEKDPLLDRLRTDGDFQTFLGEMKAGWERFRATL